MAYTTYTQPDTNAYHSAYRPLIYEVHSTNVSQYKFRYVLRIKIDGTIKAILKQSPNVNNIAVFDIQHIVRDYVEGTYLNQAGSTIIKAGETNNMLIEDNQGDIVRFTVDLGESYSTTATGVPSVTYQDSDNAVVVGLARPNAEEFATQSVGSVNSVDLNSGLIGIPRANTTAPAQGWLTERQLGVSDTSLFTGTQTVYTIDVYEGAPLPIVSLLGDSSNYDFNSDFAKLVVKVKDAGGSTQTVTITCGASTQGGASPSAVNADTECLVYAGLGKTALQAQTSQGSTFTDCFNTATTWEFQLTDGSDAATSGVWRVNEIKANCFSGDSFQVYWRNRWGGIDTLPFKGKAVAEVETSREQYRKVVGNSNTASQTVRFAYDGTEGGLTPFNTSVKRKLTLETDFLLEQESNLIMSLMQSDEVWIYWGTLGRVVSAVCTDRRTPFKTNANDRQFKYTLNFELAKENRA